MHNHGNLMKKCPRRGFKIKERAAPIQVRRRGSVPDVRACMCEALTAHLLTGLLSL